MITKEPCERNRLVRVPSAVCPVSGRDSNEKRQVGRPLCTNRIHNLQSQPGAVFKAATVVIRALVGQRRKKLVQQVAVGGVNLNQVEAGLQRSARSLLKSLDHRFDSSLVKRLRNGVASEKANALGATGCQPPSPGPSSRSPVKGALMLPLRPAWAS